MKLSVDDYDWFLRKARAWHEQALSAGRAGRLGVLTDLAGSITGLSVVLDRAMEGKDVDESRKIDELREQLNAMIRDLIQAWHAAGGTLMDA